MYIFDIEIKSCESVANTACESHADSVMYFWLLVLWLKMQPFGLSSTGIWGLLTISFSWLSCGHLILILCCIHCSDCKVRFLLLNIHVFIKQRVRNYKYHTWWSCLHITDHNHCMHKTVLNTDALNQLFTCSSMEPVHVISADVCVPGGLSHRNQTYHQFWLSGSQASGGWSMWCAATRR